MIISWDLKAVHGITRLSDGNVANACECSGTSLRMSDIICVTQPQVADKRHKTTDGSQL